MYPPCIANGSILDESSGCMEGMLFRNKKDSINALYWHIILHVVGLTLSMHRGLPSVFAVLETGVGPNEIVIRYNHP